MEGLTINEKFEMLMDYVHYFSEIGIQAVNTYVYETYVCSNEYVPDETPEFYIETCMNDEEIFELFELAKD